MKKQLLFLAVGLGVATSTMAQYASFPFDSDIFDSKSKIIATESGAGISFVNNEKGDVLALDGTDGFITLGNDAYNFEAVTYNIWFKWTTPTENQWWVRIFDFGKASDPDPGNHDVMFVTAFAFEDKLRWAIHSMAAEGGIDSILMSKEKLVLNKWYMLTMVHGDSAKLYLNGELQQEMAIGFKPNQLTFDNCYIGKSNWPDPLFQGNMDDFEIWNKKLTTAEIAAMYSPVSAIADVRKIDIRLFSSNGTIQVDLPSEVQNATVGVYSLTGSLISQSSKINNSVLVNNLSPGIYIVKVKSNEGMASEKVAVR